VGSSSPFTEGSSLTQQSLVVWLVVVGVTGWNMTFQRSAVGWVGKLGTLLGPEETSGWVFFRAASTADHLTLTFCRFLVGCGWWWLCGGVWLFVECCIVDASILLW
jgi:hypothetical protein